MTNRVKVWKYFQGPTIETKNFAFEVKVILGLESTYPDGLGATSENANEVVNINYLFLIIYI